MVTAQPADQAALRAAAEHRAIRSVLRSSRYRDEFELHLRTAAQRTDLFSVLCEDNATILHISGHGGADGIVLENHAGLSALLSSDALHEAAATAADLLRMVVLGTCESAATAHALARRLDCAIGVDGPISDDSMCAFTEEFYRATCSGLAVDRAFHAGRAAARAIGTGDAQRLRLFTRRGIRRSEVVFCGPDVQHARVVAERASTLLTNPDHELLARVKSRRNLEWELPDRLESHLAELFCDVSTVRQIVDEATRLLRRDRPEEVCIHRGRVVFTNAWTAWSTAISEAAQISPRSILALLLACRRYTTNQDVIDTAIQTVLEAS